MRSSFNQSNHKQYRSEVPSMVNPLDVDQTIYTKMAAPLPSSPPVEREDYVGGQQKKKTYETQLMAKYISTDGQNHSIISEEDGLNSQSNYDSHQAGQMIEKHSRKPGSLTLVQGKIIQPKNSFVATPKNLAITLPPPRKRIESGGQPSDKYTKNNYNSRKSRGSAASSEEIVFFSAGMTSRISDADHSQAPLQAETIEEQENEAYVSILNNQRIDTGGQEFTDSSAPDEIPEIKQTVLTRRSDHSITDNSVGEEDADGGGDTGGQKFPVKRQPRSQIQQQISQTGAAAQDYSLANDGHTNQQNSRPDQLRSVSTDVDIANQSVEQLYYNGSNAHYPGVPDAPIGFGSSGGTSTQKHVQTMRQQQQREKQQHYQQINQQAIDDDDRYTPKRVLVTPEVTTQKPVMYHQNIVSGRAATSLALNRIDQELMVPQFPSHRLSTISGHLSSDLRSQLFNLCCQLSKKQTNSNRITELIQTIKRSHQRQQTTFSRDTQQTPPRPGSFLNNPGSEKHQNPSLIQHKSTTSSPEKIMSINNVNVPPFDQILAAATAKYSTTIVDPNEDRTVISQTEIRKLAMCALCLIIQSTRERLVTYPVDFQRSVNRFRDQIEMMPSDGKVQINGLPERVKQMIKSNTSYLTRLQTETNFIDTERMIWCFPQFSSINANILNSKSDKQLPLSPQQGSYQDLINSLPDPLNFCVGIVFKDHSDKPATRQQKVESFLHQTLSTERRYLINSNLQKQGSADSFDTEKEQNMSIIDASISGHEEESQIDEAKNDFNDYTDIELHVPQQSSVIQNYNQTIPMSGRQTKSPLSMTLIAQKRPPMPAKTSSRLNYSQVNGGNHSGSKANRKMLSMTQQVATAQTPQASLKIDNQSHVAKKRYYNNTPIYRDEKTQRTRKGNAYFEEIWKGSSSRVQSNRKNETLASSFKKSTTNHTGKKSTTSQNMSFLAQTQKANKKSLNESINLTMNNSNFTNANKYNIPTHLKPSNYSLTKYKPPVQQKGVSSRSKQSFTKTSEVNFNKNSTPADVRQLTPFGMTQSYMNQTFEGTLSPYSVAQSTEIWPGSSPAPTSTIVSPRENNKQKPHRQQINTVTGSNILARPKTSLQSRLMNVVATPMQSARQDTPSTTNSRAQKTTLAQIMSLSSQRRGEKYSKEHRRGFAQTMIIHDRKQSITSRTAKEILSNKMVKNNQSPSQKSNQSINSQGTRLGQLIGNSSNRRKSTMANSELLTRENQAFPYPPDSTKQNQTLAIDAVINERKPSTGSALFIYSQQPHRKILSCQGSPKKHNLLHAQKQTQRGRSPHSSGSVGSDRSRAQHLPQTRERSLKTSIHNLNRTAMVTPRSRLSSRQKTDKTGFTAFVEQTVTLESATAFTSSHLPKTTQQKNNIFTKLKSNTSQMAKTIQQSMGAQSGSKTTREESKSHFRSGSFLCGSICGGESSDANFNLQQNSSRIMSQNGVNSIKPQPRSIKPHNPSATPVLTVNKKAPIAQTFIQL